ncbi:hypothetical protein QQF64_011836 [Cirrhinus molitorella]|uniref:CCHC-type domain-containing protein n=1 Tax=Cirrhinus molitorella TaxID=172907 RepID=A0ABR3LW31_9TELE
MASLPGERAPSLSLRHGVRCVPEQGVTVESVLLAVGEQIGCENISSASRMNKAVVVFLKEEQLVAQLIESGVVISGSFCPILPLATLTSKVTISNVPPFIPDEVIERELVRFGRIASPIKVISLGCKNSELKHVMSFRRQVFMFLKEPTLDISFRVMNEGKSFMIYASTAGLKCFECGDIGHKQFVCPHKVQANMNVVEDNVNGVGSDVNEAAGENVELERTETVIEQAIVEVQASDNEGIEVQENVVQSESQVVVVHDVRDDNFLNSEIASTSGVGMLNQTMGSTVEGLIVDEDKVEMRDEDTFSQMSGFSETGSQIEESNLYSLREINEFMDETFGRTVEIKDFFPDTDKFVKSVIKLQRTVGLDELDKKKRFRLRKLLTKLRKRK